VTSASNVAITAYQIEAAIAATHAFAPSYEATNWPQIEGLYAQLHARSPTPMIALSRAIAVGEGSGAEAGLRALEAIDGLERLQEQPFVHAARARWLKQLGKLDAAHAALHQARARARTAPEREFFDEQLARLERPSAAPSKRPV
jgi:RNA polymerase sigma-70 factor (ECF subfamily)